MMPLNCLLSSKPSVKIKLDPPFMPDHLTMLDLERIDLTRRISAEISELRNDPVRAEKHCRHIETLELLLDELLDTPLRKHPPSS
jgi:hypothetical protein